MIKEGKMMKLKLSNEWFDRLKWVAIICLPALSTFVLGLSKVYHFEELGGQIAQTITLLDALLGALLGVSHINYKHDLEDNE
jgi:hypothetical protein